MDWFNLLGVVTNPTSGHYYSYSHDTAPSSSSSSSHHLRTSRHNHHGLSSHGTPISLDHVGSNGNQYGSSDNSFAASILHAAGFTDLAGYANASSMAATSTLSSVATSVDDLTTWFDHYSRKYLGTVPGIDSPGSQFLAGSTSGVVSSVIGGGGGGDDADGLEHNGILGAFQYQNASSMLHLLEYEPEFGPDDIPSSQLESLPAEFSSLDLSSVEQYLKHSGMLGMRFEDRGGGFMVMREGRKLRMDKCKSEKIEIQMPPSDGGSTMEVDKIKDVLDIGPKIAPNAVSGSVLSTSMATIENSMMESVLQTVPEIFFSPFFDLTDPMCFEDLLVISDEEVARLREKEAELHALADRKVKEAEQIAALDAVKNGNVVVPSRASARENKNDVTQAIVRNIPTQAPTKSAVIHPQASAVDGNVITLRKPETFTSYLDAVELVLLDQVRSKSERFFRETNRFSELQQLVTGTVDEVREIRDELHSIRERCVTNVEIVPIMDNTRKDLRAISKVLEAVEDVLNCKASIASLMGVGDHLGAVEAIRLARLLLAGNFPSQANLHQMIEDGRNSGEGPFVQQRQFSLGKLKALSKVGDQLNEYEKLVVQNLTNELVESFLSWGADDNIDYRAQPLLSLTSERRSKIRSVVQSLQVCGKLSDAGLTYQKKLCELISVTIKAIVTECVADATKKSTYAVDDTRSTPPNKGTMMEVASMSMAEFFDCIDMLFEQVLGLLWRSFAVNKLCIDEGFILDDNVQKEVLTSRDDSSGSLSFASSSTEGSTQQHALSATAVALAAATDLAEKSVSELLRLRREAHSIVSFDDMRQLWDTSLAFTHQLERFSGRKAYGLRSTLMAQAKSFVERKHESNMSALVAALDSERWVQCNVSAERQASLSRLCSGRAAFLSRKMTTGGAETSTHPGPPAGNSREQLADAEVEGARYRVVWSSLLLIEMVMEDVACAAHFQTLATNVVGKVAELLRLFNTRSTHLVLGAGAIHSAARLKSINAKHLAIVTQCIALVLAVLPHIRAALMAQLPAKQHALLLDLDKIKVDYHDHSEKILNKLVSIIGGIVEHSLVTKILNTDFDARARNKSSSNGLTACSDCCPFLESVITNTKKMHQVLLSMLPPELLRDVFSRIFAYLDHKVPSLFKSAATSEQAFSMPSTDDGKVQMIDEVGFMTRTLNSLEGVQPWNFTATKILEQELDMRRESEPPNQTELQAFGAPDESSDRESNLERNAIDDVPVLSENHLPPSIIITDNDEDHSSVVSGNNPQNECVSGSTTEGSKNILDPEGSLATPETQSDDSVAADVIPINKTDHDLLTGDLSENLSVP